MGFDKRLAQVAIVVRDLDAKVAAWSALLGREPDKLIVTRPHAESGTEYHGEPTEARLKVAVWSLGDCELELMEPFGGPSVWQDHLDEHGEGIHHLGFVRDDIEAGVAELDRHGIRVLQSAHYQNDYEKGSYAYFGSDEKLGGMLEINVLEELPR